MPGKGGTSSVCQKNGKEFQAVDPEAVHHCTIGSGDYRYTEINDNISDDPLFVDPDNDNYRLDPSASCIDRGDKEAPSIPLVDIDRKSRIINEQPDMGAYEYMETVAHEAAPGIIQDLDDLFTR